MTFAGDQVFYMYASNAYYTHMQSQRQNSAHLIAHDASISNIMHEVNASIHPADDHKGCDCLSIAGCDAVCQQ